MYGFTRETLINNLISYQNYLKIKEYFRDDLIDMPDYKLKKLDNQYKNRINAMEFIGLR